MGQSCRARIERDVAWLKPIAALRKVKLRGLSKVDQPFVFACAAFNLNGWRACSRPQRHEHGLLSPQPATPRHGTAQLDRDAVRRPGPYGPMKHSFGSFGSSRERSDLAGLSVRLKQ